MLQVREGLRGWVNRVGIKHVAVWFFTYVYCIDSNVFNLELTQRTLAMPACMYSLN